MTYEEFHSIYSNKIKIGPNAYVHFENYYFVLSIIVNYEKEYSMALEPPIIERLIAYVEKFYEDNAKCKEAKKCTL